jgi:mono/diheme cytochrome c family protein
MRRYFFPLPVIFSPAAALLLIFMSGCLASCRPRELAEGVGKGRGRTLYEVSCGACHQVDGEGKEGVSSPLAGSEWVTGSEGRLLRIALDGVRGPIMVRGRRYQLEMPALRHVYDDADMAAILTYIRGAWGNAAPAVTTGAVAAVRSQTASRGDSWTAQELGSH